MALGCKYDRVEIFDGDSSTAPLLMTHCGVATPGVLYSSRNRLLVVFETDGAVTKNGFSINVKQVGPIPQKNNYYIHR